MCAYYYGTLSVALRKSHNLSQCVPLPRDPAAYRRRGFRQKIFSVPFVDCFIGSGMAGRAFKSVQVRSHGFEIGS